MPVPRHCQREPSPWFQISVPTPNVEIVRYDATSTAGASRSQNKRNWSPSVDRDPSDLRRYQGDTVDPSWVKTSVFDNATPRECCPLPSRLLLRPRLTSDYSAHQTQPNTRCIRLVTPAARSSPGLSNRSYCYSRNALPAVREPKSAHTSRRSGHIVDSGVNYPVSRTAGQSARNPGLELVGLLPWIIQFRLVSEISVIIV